MAAQKKNGNGESGQGEGTKKARVAALLKTGGKTYRQIASEVGCAESYVSIIAGELGMTKKRGPSKGAGRPPKASTPNGSASRKAKAGGDSVVELLQSRRAELLDEVARIDEALRVLTRR